MSANRTAPPRRLPVLGALLAVLALLVGLAACAEAPEQSDSAGPAGPHGGGSDSATDGGEGAARGPAEQDADAGRAVRGEAADEQAAGASGDPAGSGAGTVEQVAGAYGSAPEGAMVARDAEIDLAVEELEPAASRVRAAAVAVEGYVLSEELHPDPETQDGHATLVLSVPSQRLDRALEQLAEIGEERGRSVWSEDVTADYVDSAARVETLQASVERTRRLMQQAESIEDIVALERELARREADLDALTAHVAALEDDVARSALTVHLTASDDLAQQAEPAPAGFLAGLDQGWAAFTTFVTGALTVLGALLPFLLLVLVLLVPAAVLLRRRRARA